MTADSDTLARLRTYADGARAMARTVADPGHASALIELASTYLRTAAVIALLHQQKVAEAADIISKFRTAA